jgi:hypothetical protein
LEDVTMIRTSKRRLAGLGLAGAALLLSAGSAAAAAPAVDTWTVHVERPFADCSGFSVTGVWEIGHRLTTFVDADGVATRDIEQVDFTGRLVNTSTGAWVADSGSRTFFDTLAPDGSFLTTYMVQVRHSAYVHTAGRTDFQTGESVGRDGFAPENIAALCTALAG